MDGDERFAWAVVERDQYAGIDVVQDVEDGFGTVVAGAHVYAALLEEGSLA